MGLTELHVNSCVVANTEVIIVPAVLIKPGLSRNFKRTHPFLAGPY